MNAKMNVRKLYKTEKRRVDAKRKREFSEILKAAKRELQLQQEAAKPAKGRPRRNAVCKECGHSRVAHDNAGSDIAQSCRQCDCRIFV